jgi:hypothetical protein
LLGVGMLHRYNSATDGSPTYTRTAPADPGTSTVTSHLQDSLEGDGQDLHRAWLDYELADDPDPSENPLETGIPPAEDPNNRCRISTPASDPDTTTDPWTEHDHFLRRDQSGNMVDTSLYWGQEIPPGNKPWEGFGYRKLAQKHGWAQQDIDATVAALALAPVGPITTVHHQTRWEYTGPEYTPSGTNYICARRVVVQTSADAGEPQPRQIITSYGRFMRYS